MNEANLGDKALANSDWQSAIDHYTRALIEHPRAPTYYIKRATAYTRRRKSTQPNTTGDNAEHGAGREEGPDFEAALRDAETALVLARERGKRELILDAQMRRGVALFQLGRYGDAKFIFGIVREKIPASSGNKEGGDRSEQLQAAMAQGGGSAGGGSAAPKQKHEQELTIWEIKVKGKLSKLEEGSEQTKITVKEYPDLKLPGEEELRKALKAQLCGTAKEGSSVGESQKVTSGTASKTQEAKMDIDGPGSSAPLTSGPAAPTAPAKIRHEWYQSNDSVVITLYCKGVPKDKLDVDLQNTSVSLDFPLPSNSSYSFTLDPLCHPIKPSESKVTVLSTKIEISLRKETPGQKWSSLESSVAGASQPLADRSAALASAAAQPASSNISATTTTDNRASASGPAYPTSSRRGVKDWDKLATDLTTKKKKNKSATSGPKESDKKSPEGNEDEEGEKSDAESIDSEYGGADPVDGFFKKLYANADDDTRRAMVKSYYESQGTALSTNWDEVGKGKVEARPPE